MTKYARKSKRRISPARIDRPGKEQISDKVATLPPVTGPISVAAKSPAAGVGTSYDPQKHIVTELKYSALVGVVIAILLAIAYILFR